MSIQYTSVELQMLMGPCSYPRSQMDENGALVEGEVTSETQITHSKPFTSDTLTATNPIRTAPGANQDFCSEKWRLTNRNVHAYPENVFMSYTHTYYIPTVISLHPTDISSYSDIITSYKQTSLLQ